MILRPWKQPIKIEVDFEQRCKLRRVEEKCENLDADNNSDCEGPKAKKVKLMGYKPQPRVAFSGFRADELKELVKKVKAIGGIVSNSMHESTHLVTPGFKRTEKWYKAMHSGTFLNAPYSTFSNSGVQSLFCT